MASEPKLSILFTKDEIEAAVDRLAAEIKRDFLEKNPILIAVLKGSFMLFET